MSARLPALEWLRTNGGDWLRELLVGDEALAVDELADRDDVGLFGPESATWKVHADAAMLIGGLRALLFQTLHPLAMAGVADHSDYRSDPWGRLRRTSRFVGATCYGSTATAEKAIRTVRRIHARVEGTAPDGRPYRANDPHLLLWVHATEVDSFLQAVDRHGNTTLTAADRDAYVAEMGEVARRLGSSEPPSSVAELDETLTMFRAECHRTDSAAEAVHYLLRPDVPPLFAPSYQIISGAAIALLPTWARQELRLPVPPGLRPLAIDPSASMLMRTLDWLLADDSAHERVAERFTDNRADVGETRADGTR